MVTVLFASTLASLPMVFLDSASLADAQGVRVEAQKPQSFEVLIRADEDKPSLWFMPTAVQSRQEGVWIWYQRVDKQEETYADQRTLCVAVLTKEGLTLPRVDEAEPAWGGPNNVVLRRSPHTPTWGGFNVFQMAITPKGLTLLYWDQPPEGEAGAMLAYSRDGLHWEKDARGAVFTEHNDAYSLLEKDGQYLLYQTMLAPWPDKPYSDNLDKFRRVQSIRHSPDLIQWTPQEVMLEPDAQDDPTTEFYLMKAFPYGQGYAALLMKYYADPAKPKEHSAILSNELMVSDDARTWRRPYRDVDLGFWSYAEPFEYHNMLTFAAHQDRHFTLFQYRPQGLIRVIADSDGSFVTPVFTMPARGIALNADCRNGWIEATLLNAETQPVASVEPIRIEDQDGPALSLERFGSDITTQRCRLRVVLHQASLYGVVERNPTTD